MNDEIPFKLGGKCLQLLQELFLFGDFSVKKFLLAYKVGQIIFHCFKSLMMHVI